MSEAARVVGVRGAGVGHRDEAVRVRDGYARRSATSISASFATPCATPLTAIMAGFVLAQRWQSGLITLLVIAAWMAVRPIVASGWIERLSTATGLALYCAAVYLLWAVAIGPDIQGVARFLGGALLIFFSFSTWLSSLFLERGTAWMSRAVAGLTLAAAVLILAWSTGGGIG